MKTQDSELVWCSVRIPRQSTIRRRTDDELEELAQIAEYIGSEEHKDRRWWGGRPMSRQLRGGRVGRVGRQKTSICPLNKPEDRDVATEWVRSAIRERKFRFYESDKKFPKKVWYEAEGQVWMGLRVTDILGQYKGWPSNEAERDEVFG